MLEASVQMGVSTERLDLSEMGMIDAKKSKREGQQPGKTKRALVRKRHWIDWFILSTPILIRQMSPPTVRIFWRIACRWLRIYPFGIALDKRNLKQKKNSIPKESIRASWSQQANEWPTMRRTIHLPNLIGKMVSSFTKKMEGRSNQSSPSEPQWTLLKLIVGWVCIPSLCSLHLDWHCDSTQFIRWSTYSGALHSIGFLILTPSAHK